MTEYNIKESVQMILIAYSGVGSESKNNTGSLVLCVFLFLILCSKISLILSVLTQMSGKCRAVAVRSCCCRK